MSRFLWGLGRLSGVLCVLGLLACIFGADAAQAAAKTRQNAVANVYDNQPPVTEKELNRFVDLLPQFRAWARANNEEAHPQIRQQKPDFLYSRNAADWVRSKGWDPGRFFCVMGRMAAALVIVEEGNDMRGTRPKDMPSVSDKELELARRHLGILLRAGGQSAPPPRVEK